MLEFNLRFPTAQSFRPVADILAVCLASLHPLTLPQVFTAVSAMSVTAELSWPEFLANYGLLADFLVKRRDESVCLFHPLFREWLLRRGDKELTRFLVDPRQGHSSLALALSGAW